MQEQSTDDRERLLAGHLLRRAGFGPSPADMRIVLEMGYDAYLNRQLNPSSIDDSEAEARYPRYGPNFIEWNDRVFLWLTRMQLSRRQLLEKMTLLWHEHFATSIQKVKIGGFMEHQEDTLRRRALGSFPKLLAGVTRDQAMLSWLDNNFNDGKAEDEAGNRVPPNANFARELLQLFTIGPVRLNLDGTPALGADGRPVPNYTEQDVLEIARALTGWSIHPYNNHRDSVFIPRLHDAKPKTVLGERIEGRRGADGAREVDDVVAILMRHDSMAPFISKMLVQKLATETPTPGYVERVATVFARTGGGIRATVRAVLTDEEFTSDAVVRTQYNTPRELAVGAARALECELPHSSDLIGLLRDAGHLPYWPPSVFSFYRPGGKGALVDTAYVLARDGLAHLVLRADNERPFDPAAMIRDRGLRDPGEVVDHLATRLLAAPLGGEATAVVVDYLAGRMGDDAVRGAAWLLLCSPDYQRH
jgi:uncharacterized protein (DUF1800 family)